MSRIRSIKPETWVSETLAEVSIPAMVTFVAMTNHADDQGRHRDNAAVVYGLVWPMREKINRTEAEEHLQQLAAVGAICRYVGCDGRRYFHYPTWRKHQKIDKPSLSRLSACPHCEPERCGVCKGPCIQRAAVASVRETLTEDSRTTLRGVDEPSTNTPGVLAPGSEPPSAPRDSAPPATVATTEPCSGRIGGLLLSLAKPQVKRHSARALRRFGETSRSTRRLDPGSWILDLLPLRGARRPMGPPTRSIS
ncbi:hypothetical protein GCM10010440_75580 [Kitasatospora cinereorecta]